MPILLRYALHPKPTDPTRTDVAEPSPCLLRPARDIRQALDVLQVIDVCKSLQAYFVTVRLALHLQADRSVFSAQLNLHARDLRVLDPMLTQMNACAILCRERAILINLEHIKCIVTTSYVLVLNVENKAVLSFLDELQKKLRQQVRQQLTPLAHASC